MDIHIYNSSIGTFRIRETGHERYELWLDQELLGAYGSAELAAKDVANFDTDNPEWDKFKNQVENFPSSLNQWTKVEDEFQE